MTRSAERTIWERAQLLHALDDHETFARESLSIRNLGGSVVPLVSAAGQRKLSAAIQRQEQAGKPVRILGLKTRRSWFTTGACSEIFRHIPFYPGRKGMIVADKFRPAALEAFDYLKQFQSGYKPLTRYEESLGLPNLVKDTEMEIRWENGSSIDVYSADGGEVRGGGRHWALCDEAAFWRAAEITLLGVMSSVPKLPGTGIIILSTANGVGGEFYDLWQEAQNPQSDSLFEPLFFGWLEHEVYRMPLTPDEGAQLQRSLTQEEQHLHNFHGATLEQLKWRRVTIATECGGKVDKFHQEYPTTAEEAFISSGRPALDLDALSRHPIIEVASRGELRLDEEETRKRLLYIPNSHGQLAIHQKPIRGRFYVLGADPSKGVDVSEAKRGANPDYSVAMVADQHTGEEVALLRGRIRPMAFAEYVVLLAIYYNYAYMCPEANDPGFIDGILRTGYPMDLIYHRQRDPSDRNPDMPDKLGFYVTEITRKHLVGVIDDAIRTMSITIHSPIVRSECQTFVTKPNGKAEHMDNHHDDCVFAFGHTEMARRLAPEKRRPVGELAMAAKAEIGYYGRKQSRDEDEEAH